MKKQAETNLVDHFKQTDHISREALFNYFLTTEGELNEGTFGWRVYDLKRKGIIREVKRGLYILNAKPRFDQPLNKEVKELAAIFTLNYKNAQYCIWNMNWLNEFTVHQFNKDVYFVETEKDLMESVAHTFLDRGYNNIILSSKSNPISVISSINPVILLPLISRAPVQSRMENGIRISVPILEKILVDIYDDEKNFSFIQGAEMVKIFENALNRYSVNYTTFWAYAKRRGKDVALLDFLSTNFPELIKDFI